VLDPKEGQRRLHSLATHVLNRRYVEWLRVFERQKSGRIHYHLLVVLGDDIRTGCDFEAFARRDYRTAGTALRREWAFWRRAAGRYRFGRTELLPIRSTAEAAAAYVGKYIGKHVEAREERDKGVRLVAYSSGACMARTRFSWSESGRAWRAGVGVLAEGVARSRGWPPGSVKGTGLSSVLGPKWAYTWRETILALGEVALQKTGDNNNGDAKRGGEAPVIRARVAEEEPGQGAAASEAVSRTAPGEGSGIRAPLARGESGEIQENGGAEAGLAVVAP
jgi:hypothetical protein